MWRGQVRRRARAVAPRAGFARHQGAPAAMPRTLQDERASAGRRPGRTPPGETAIEAAGTGEPRERMGAAGVGRTMIARRPARHPGGAP